MKKNIAPCSWSCLLLPPLLLPPCSWSCLLLPPPSPPATASLQLILKGKIGQTVILGLIIGLVYLHIADDLTGVQDREGSLFFLAVQGEWLGPGGVGGGGGQIGL